MTEREMLEKIAGGSCLSFACNVCPILRNGCEGFSSISESRHRFGSLPESVRSAARAKLAEMYKGQDNSIVDIKPLRDIATLHRMRGGEYETVELTTAQYDAIFDMVKAIREAKK